MIWGAPPHSLELKHNFSQSKLKRTFQIKKRDLTDKNSKWEHKRVSSGRKTFKNSPQKLHVSIFYYFTRSLGPAGPSRRTILRVFGDVFVVINGKYSCKVEKWLYRNPRLVTLNVIKGTFNLWITDCRSLIYSRKLPSGCVHEFSLAWLDLNIFNIKLVQKL